MRDNDPGGERHPLYTIGHSNHDIAPFVELLLRHRIEVVVDVRSIPYSRFAHFRREPLRRRLQAAGMRYGWLGQQLGAKRSEPECLVDGRPNFARMARLATFREGIERVRRGNQSHTIALLCAERDPVDCHRMILVCRALRPFGLTIRHILADGGVEEHATTEERLVQLTGAAPGLFAAASGTPVEEAYDVRGAQMTRT